MPGLEEITEDLRTDEDDDSRQRVEEESNKRSRTKRKRSKKRRNSGGIPGQDPEAIQEEDGDRERITEPLADGQKQDTPPIREDPQAEFYKNYRKVAEEYDKEFLKKHDEDLNTTLIFAGLFSAVASAFIIEVDSQLQPDPNDETHALLRILIYKIDNTTFGNVVPTLPNWTGPPHATVHVQAILFASLAASLFSAFLAMLGKQWLNRYDSADLRGTVVERSQNRQRKLDGIVTWYFNNVMELLPLMLQAALLLFGCALSRYLWEINRTIASVLIGVTSFGALSYLFIIIAGTVYESCPYQTPGAHILRHYLIPPLRSVSAINFSKITSKFFSHITSNFSSEFPDFIESSYLHQTITFSLEYLCVSSHRSDILGKITLCIGLIPWLPFALFLDFCLFWGLVLELLAPFSRIVYSTLMTTYLHLRTRNLGQQPITLDLQCVLWVIQTSLDKAFHLSALKYLTAMSDLRCFDPSLAISSLNIFISCINITNGTPVMVQGLRQLTELSASFFLRTLHHFSSTAPTSGTIIDLRRRYNRVLPSHWVDFRDLPICHTLTAAHLLANPLCVPPRGWRCWDDNRPSAQEHIQLAWGIVGAALDGYQQRGKTPRWTLRFALDSLSLDPPPPRSVVIDCLKIIAIDLGCDVSNNTTLHESTLETLPISVTQRLKFRGDFPVPNSTLGHKAVQALLPYAISLEQSGYHDMFDAILNFARNTPFWHFSWGDTELHIVNMLSEETAPSLNRATILLSPYLDSRQWDKEMVTRWAAVASTALYSEKVVSSVVNTLLQLGTSDTLRPDVPIGMWAWLKKQPSLPPSCHGRYDATQESRLIRYLRGLGDLDILKSYFVVVWSEWDHLEDSHFYQAQTSIVEDFVGISMQPHRTDLIKRLDHVIKRLNRGLDHFQRFEWWIKEGEIQGRKRQYETLRKVLLKVDKRATRILTESHSTFTCSLPLPYT